MEREVRVLSLHFTPYTMEGALTRAQALIEAGGCARVYTPNAEIALRAARTPAFSDMLARAELLLPDGVGVSLAARLYGEQLPRLTGIDFAEALLARAPRRYRVYLLGGKAGVAVRAGRALAGRYPRAEIVGARHGYFPREEERRVYDEITAARPDLLFVCLGSPRQEEWIERLRPPCLSIGLGGALDVWAGDKARAPRALRQAGGEWLFRLLQDPSRIVRAGALPAFALRVLLDRWHNHAKCRGSV